MLFDSTSKDNTNQIINKYKEELGDKFDYWTRPYDKEDKFKTFQSIENKYKYYTGSKRKQDGYGLEFCHRQFNQ